MKRTIRKIIAIALAAALIICTLTGCSDLLYTMMETYDTYEDYSSGSYEDYFNSMYSDYYNYSDYSDYYSDYYYGDSSTDDSAYSNTDYADFYNYFSEYLNSYYDTADMTGGMGGNISSNGGAGGSITPGSGSLTISSNILGEALREQFTDIQGNGRDKVTVMVYMCGSNLESDSGFATMDLKEMARATANENLRIVVECGGTRNWQTSGISGNCNQRLVFENGSLRSLERNARRDMTDGDTLSDFITFCAENYPADRNMLILWDHGAGAVDGWGYDEFNYSDALTIDELGEALYESGVKFDFIGFDACLMSTMEVACVLYDFADYMIASEDYEPGYGWEYQYWLDALSKNTSIPTPELGKIICDDFITESGSEAAILSVVDLSYMKLVYSTWKDFAYAAKDQLLDANFSWETENTSRIGGDETTRLNIQDLLGSVISTQAEIEDMLAIANAVENVPEAEALISALENAIIYCAANSKDAHMTGLAVSLPYGDSASYRDIQTIFRKAGFDSEYIDFLGEFTSVSSDSLYDWSNWYDMYDGYDSWSEYYNGNSYDNSNYGWDSWYGWDDYNSGDYGWSDYDYYDYYSGDSQYDTYDFFDYYDFFSDYFGTTDGSGYGYGYGDPYGGYGSNYGYGSDYGYGNDYGSGYGDIWDYFFSY